MQVNVEIDTSLLQAKVLKEQKRLVYNTVEAINQTAKAVQAQVREDMARDFHLRSANKKGRKWLLDRIKIKFAGVKKGLLYAEIYVDQKPRLLLGQFEEGGMREPFKGKNIAVPITATAREGGGKGGEVRQELTFKALGLKPVSVTPRLKADRVQFKGKERTFILKSTAKHPMGGVFQRTGPGRDDIRMVYSFQKAFQLRRLLRLVQRAKQIYQDKFQVELAIAYAKGGGMNRP